MLEAFEGRVNRTRHVIECELNQGWKAQNALDDAASKPA